MAFEEFNKEYILNFLDEYSSSDIKREPIEVMISTEDGLKA